MKKLLLLFILAVSTHLHSSAQVICVICYDQNDSISSGVTNLLYNGSFENTNCVPNNWFNSSYCPNSSYYNCNFPGWVCTGGGTSTYADACDANYSIIPEGNTAVYFGNSFCDICPTAGDTSCMLTEGCQLTGIPAGLPMNGAAYGNDTGVVLSQTVLGLTVGRVYVLEFWAGGEDLGSFPIAGVFGLDVGFGNMYLRNPGSSPVTGIGRRFIVQFIANSSTHTFRFTNWGHMCSSCTELILDDVRLYDRNQLAETVPHCQALGVSENMYSNALVYPNPVTEQLTVSMGRNEQFTFTLYDVTSRKLTEQIFDEETTLPTGNLSKGIYYYEITTSSGLAKQGKIVKN